MAMRGKNGMGIDLASAMAAGGSVSLENFLDALQRRTNEHIQHQIRKRWMVQNEIPAELDDLPNEAKFLISTWAVENLAKIYTLLLQGNGPCHCRPLEGREDAGPVDLPHARKPHQGSSAYYYSSITYHGRHTGPFQRAWHC